MRLVTLLLLALATQFSLGSIQPAAALCLLDQEQPVIDPSVAPFFIGGDSEQKLAQVFTAGVTDNLCEVQLTAECATGALTGDLTVSIRNTVGGKPGSVILAQVEIPGASIPHQPGGPAFRSFVFPEPPMLVAGMMYAVVLTAVGTCSMPGIPFGDIYGPGDGYFTSDTVEPYEWICMCDFPPARNDLPFKTFMGERPVRTLQETWGGLKGIYR